MTCTKIFSSATIRKKWLINYLNSNILLKQCLYWTNIAYTQKLLLFFSAKYEYCIFMQIRGCLSCLRTFLWNALLFRMIRTTTVHTVLEPSLILPDRSGSISSHFTFHELIRSWFSNCCFLNDANDSRLWCKCRTRGTCKMLYQIFCCGNMANEKVRII